MFDLDAFTLESTEAVYGLVAFFIVNVLIHLFLINKLFEERKRNRELARQIKDENKIIRDFLENQHHETRAYNRRFEKQIVLDKEVIFLRAAYMKLESNAMAYQADTTPYWNYLNEQLRKVLKAVVPQMSTKERDVDALQNKIALLKEKIQAIPSKNDDPVIKEKKERIVIMLDNIAQQHINSTEDKTRLKKQIEKVEHLIQLFEDPELRRQYTAQKRQQTYVASSQTHLNTLQDNRLINESHIRALEHSLENNPSSPAMEEELQRFKDENSKLHLHVEQLKQELREFQERLNNAPSDTSEQKKARDMLALSDDLLSASEKEMDRLRDVISNQRRAISEMAESLEHLQHMNNSETSEHRQQVEKLRRCIQESEICIGMLEQELGELKQDLTSIRDSRDETSITGAEVGQLDVELNTIKVDLEKALDKNRRSDAILEFVREALNAASVEDISLLVYEHIASLKFESSLVIKAPERMIEMAPQNSLAMRDKVLINAMQINEINPGRDGQLAFRFLNIAGLVRPESGEEIDSEDQSYLLELAKIADRIIGQLALNQRAKSSFKVLDNAVNTIKQTSYELDQILDESAKKTKKLISNNFGEVQDIARTTGLGASHIASFNALEQETLKQLEAENTIRLKLRKQFLALLNQLENSG
jgi:Chromosome segregation ATPases